MRRYGLPLSLPWVRDQADGRRSCSGASADQPIHFGLRDFANANRQRHLPCPTDIAVSVSDLHAERRSSRSAATIDIYESADRIKIFRGPELQPSAHSRLVNMFAEIGIPMHVACSASTPADMRWMVKAGYGLALIDQAFPLDTGLTSRPIADVNWTADTVFVHHNRTDHIALPFIEHFLAQRIPGLFGAGYSVRASVGSAL